MLPFMILGSFWSHFGRKVQLYLQIIDNVQFSFDLITAIQELDMQARMEGAGPEGPDERSGSLAEGRVAVSQHH